MSIKTSTPVGSAKSSSPMTRTSDVRNSAPDKDSQKEGTVHGAGRCPYVARFVAKPLYDKARRTANLYVEDACIGCALRQCPPP